MTKEVFYETLMELCEKREPPFIMINEGSGWVSFYKSKTFDLAIKKHLRYEK
jgi:hypothetical protein